MSTQTYTGSCHCRAVAFTVDLDLDQALRCNCSICTKLGAVWAFAPKARMTFTSGADALDDYQFGQKRLHHRFCRHCGIESFAEGVAPDGTPTVGINLRCLDGVEIEKLTPRLHDGRSL
ncbi:Uncharacterized conserved protein [Enhydrobacter aerosaccus]|uniref:Uncharacterized conserved protein n=1 Tax=Enhydrobacter aerosaccus TaxID=225324 RepID=A0A1T4RZQ1_9HYPH|nr:GFA family protein [Enhydrobacter aerosaccus]SKA21499.1 Uncharacterized conserved protein [Enhydrobacter aerosaccus]